MKLPLIAAVSLGLFTCSAGAADVPLKDLTDKASYSIGLDIGKNLKRSGVDINVQALAAGVTDGVGGAKAKLTDEEIVATMSALQKEVTAKQTEKNKTFLEENKKKPGVKVSATGLQYTVLKEGAGKKPKATDSVTVHYKGTLVDGTEFDSSYKRGEPVSFDVTGVIPGWTEALQLMSEGSKYQLVIPGNLAYGERGEPRAGIGPNATLLFDVELIKVGK
jgi:FKBP-type peptidyl-prolyl cis-trans isomerase FklB